MPLPLACMFREHCAGDGDGNGVGGVVGEAVGGGGGSGDAVGVGVGAGMKLAVIVVSELSVMVVSGELGLAMGLPIHVHSVKFHPGFGAADIGTTSP